MLARSSYMGRTSSTYIQCRLDPKTRRIRVSREPAVVDGATVIACLSNPNMNREVAQQERELQGMASLR